MVPLLHRAGGKVPWERHGDSSVPLKAKLCPSAGQHGAVLCMHGDLHSDRGTSRCVLATSCSSTGTAHAHLCFLGTLLGVGHPPIGEAYIGQVSDAKNVKNITKPQIKTQGSEMALVKMPPPLSPWIYLGDVRLLAAADKTPPSTRETQSPPERVARSKSRAVCSPAALSR